MQESLANTMEMIKETSCALQRSAKRQIKLVIIVVRDMESFFPYVCDEIAPIVHFFTSDESDQERKSMPLLSGGGKNIV